MEIIHKIKNKLAQDTYKYWRQFLFLIIIFLSFIKFTTIVI